MTVSTGWVPASPAFKVAPRGERVAVVPPTRPVGGRAGCLMDTGISASCQIVVRSRARRRPGSSSTCPRRSPQASRSRACARREAEVLGTTSPALPPTRGCPEGWGVPASNDGAQQAAVDRWGSTLRPFSPSCTAQATEQAPAGSAGCGFGETACSASVRPGTTRGLRGGPITGDGGSSVSGGW
jgi:hypothetical protein